MLKESTPIGELYLKTFEKINTDKVEVRELSQDMHKDYISNLHKAAESGIKKYKGDFYIQVLNKSEKLITTLFLGKHALLRIMIRQFIGLIEAVLK